MPKIIEISPGSFEKVYEYNYKDGRKTIRRMKCNKNGSSLNERKKRKDCGKERKKYNICSNCGHDKTKANNVEENKPNNMEENKANNMEENKANNMEETK